MDSFSQEVSPEAEYTVKSLPTMSADEVDKELGKMTDHRSNELQDLSVDPKLSDTLPTPVKRPTLVDSTDFLELESDRFETLKTVNFASLSSSESTSEQGFRFQLSPEASEPSYPVVKKESSYVEEVARTPSPGVKKVVKKSKKKKTVIRDAINVGRFPAFRKQRLYRDLYDAKKAGSFKIINTPRHESGSLFCNVIDTKEDTQRFEADRLAINQLGKRKGNLAKKLSESDLSEPATLDVLVSSDEVTFKRGRLQVPEDCLIGKCNVLLVDEGVMQQCDAAHLYHIPKKAAEKEIWRMPVKVMSSREFAIGQNVCLRPLAPEVNGDGYLPCALAN